MEKRRELELRAVDNSGQNKRGSEGEERNDRKLWEKEEAWEPGLADRRKREFKFLRRR